MSPLVLFFPHQNAMDGYWQKLQLVTPRSSIYHINHIDDEPVTCIRYNGSWIIALFRRDWIFFNSHGGMELYHVQSRDFPVVVTGLKRITPH